MVKYWISLTLITCSLLVLSCQKKDQQMSVVEQVEKAHGLAKWWQTEALQADVMVEFGGKKIIDGTFTFETNGGRVHAKLKNGTTSVFDGKEAWVSPASAEFPRARFHLLTWPWFIATPMKLRGKNTHLTEFEKATLQGEELLKAKQTFESGTGDTPDDWYIIYVDPQTKLVQASAYIVTYGKSLAKAKEDPHAITFDQYQDVAGTKLATKWTFWHWQKDKGIYGEPIGKGKVSNLQFVKPEAGLFSKPEDAKKDKLPEINQE